MKAVYVLWLVYSLGSRIFSLAKHAVDLALSSIHKKLTVTKTEQVLFEIFAALQNKIVVIRPFRNWPFRTLLKFSPIFGSIHTIFTH